MPFCETGMLLKETRTKLAVMATTSQDQETSFTAALLKTSERTEELDQQQKTKYKLSLFLDSLQKAK